MNLKHVSVIILLFLYSCGESEEDNRKIFNEIRRTIISNYNDKREAFIKLKSYLSLRHIKYVEFKNNKIVKIKYQVGNEIDKEELKEFENKDIVSADIKNVLDLDSLSVNDLLQLKASLTAINTDNLWIIDNYDAIRRKYTKEIDLRYTKSMNGLHFFYRLYQESLNSLPDNSSGILTNGNTTGGILGDNIVWYYK